MDEQSILSEIQNILDSHKPDPELKLVGISEFFQGDDDRGPVVYCDWNLIA